MPVGIRVSQSEEGNTMRVIQLVSNLNIGDAIGNEVIEIHRALTDQGFGSEIVTVAAHDQYKDLVNHITIQDITSDDVVIFHKAAGDNLSSEYTKLPAKKVLLYHNITPASFFWGYDLLMWINLIRGRIQLQKCVAASDAVWADSMFNMEEIISCLHGATPRCAVIPILRTINTDLSQDEALAGQLCRIHGTKLLFVSRVAPNKCIQDVIKLYHQYRSDWDPNAILHIVGSWEGNEKYYAKLKGFASELGLDDSQVVFTGKVSEAAKNTYFAQSDCFVCMSEHEGFCVPLLEAMQADLPVIAFAGRTAISETLSDNALLFHRKDYPHMASKLHDLMTDEAFRQLVLNYQRYSRDRFRKEIVLSRLFEELNQVIQLQPSKSSGKTYPPLWKIRNRVYQTYSRGVFKRKVERYSGKLKQIIAHTSNNHTAGTGG